MPGTGRGAAAAASNPNPGGDRGAQVPNRSWTARRVACDLGLARSDRQGRGLQIDRGPHACACASEGRANCCHLLPSRHRERRSDEKGEPSASLSEISSAISKHQPWDQKTRINRSGIRSYRQMALKLGSCQSSGRARLETSFSQKRERPFARSLRRVCFRFIGTSFDVGSGHECE